MRLETTGWITIDRQDRPQGMGSTPYPNPVDCPVNVYIHDTQESAVRYAERMNKDGNDLRAVAATITLETK